MNNQSVLEKIKENYSKMTKSQKLIANHFIKNYKTIPAVSVQELSYDLDISDATIIRFAKFLGYKGYLELRSNIKAELNNYYSPFSRFDRTSKSYDSLPVKPMSVETIIKNDITCLSHFYNTFDLKTLAEITDYINNANRIHLLGIGTDSVLSNFLSWYLDIMGYQCATYTDGGFDSLRRLSNIDANDLLIIFATPRFLKIEETVLRIAKAAQATRLLITTDSNNLLPFLANKTVKISDMSNEMMNSYVVYMSLCNMIIAQLYESNKEKIDEMLLKSDTINEIEGLFI